MASCGALAQRERRGEPHDSTVGQCRGNSTVGQTCFEEMATAGVERGGGIVVA
jgi:hypothetical protein